MHPVILVTDGENRSSLAVTRSLGKMGCRVVVSGKKIKNISAQSKYCHKSYQIQDPAKDEARFFADLLEVIRTEKVNFVYPMTEPTLFSFVKNHKQLPPDISWVAIDSDQVEKIFNKYKLFKLAAELGVPVPKTLFVSHPDELAEKAEKIAEYPVVVKPGMSRVPTDNGYMSTGVMYARNREELEYFYQRKPGLAFPSMIQEKIIGPGTGLFTLFDGDKHLALFSHKRIREKPPSGGVSVVCESVSLDPEMVESARELLAAVGWKGVAMVEFKRDDRDGRAKLIEINGRFWGSLQLAISSGIDFPQLLLGYLHGNSHRGIQDQYQVGLRLKWFLGTLDHLIIRLKNRDVALNLPPGYPSKLSTIYEFLKIKNRKTVFDVFNARDIKPFLQELSEYIGSALCR